MSRAVQKLRACNRLVGPDRQTFRHVGFLLLLLAGLLAPGSAQAQSFAQVVAGVQPKIVKIFGSGGIRGLEAYQSGFLISAEGHVLTCWSYVLDSDDFLVVVLDDGQRFEAEVVNHDPRLEIAVLKIDAQGLPHFNLSDSVDLEPGDRVLAFSNLYGVATGNEPVSVVHGVVSAHTDLAARRGAFESVYRGPVYVLDAITNNPGAAGGALTDRRGRLAGILGKELRNSLNNTWLNYSIPAGELISSVDEILAGRTPPRRPEDEANRPEMPHTLDTLGLILVPDILPKTPPFVDGIHQGSPAEAAGLLPDDLILFVNNRMAPSRSAFLEELRYIDRIDEVSLTVQRGQELVEIVIQP